MIGLTIATSKPGRLWPVEYWKCLIDSLSRGGAKHDPQLRYPVFASALATLVRADNGRFLPTAASRLATRDDTAISFLRIKRVAKGEDGVSFHQPTTPDTRGWPVLDFDFFGTIGSSQQEAQTKRNEEKLRDHVEYLTQEPRPSALCLHFQLAAARRDRDLDNLADALMPFFNELFPGLVDIQLSKGLPGMTERLWVSLRAPP